MLGGRRSGQNQALEQTRDSVLRYGERVGCELLNFVVRRNRKLIHVAMHSVLDQYVGCNECMAEVTVQHAFDRADASWPNQSWITFTCETCGCSNPLLVRDGSITEGYLDGAPAPCLIPKRHISIPGLIAQCDNGGVRLRNLNLSWLIPSKR